jgi:hypothetical protein
MGLLEIRAKAGGRMARSNLARSSAQFSVLQQSLPLLTQLLSNPGVLGSLKEQGLTVNWKEVVRLWGDATAVLDENEVLVPIRSKKSK